VAKNTFEFNSF